MKSEQAQDMTRMTGVSYLRREPGVRRGVLRRAGSGLPALSDFW